MTPAERNRRFRQVRAEMLRARTQLQRETRAQIVTLMQRALQEIKVTLASAPSDYQRWSLPQLERDIRQILSEMQSGASSALRSSANSAWQSGQELVTAPLEAGGLSIVANLPEIDPQQLNAIRTFMVSRMADITERTASAIVSELGLVIIGAQSPSDAIAAIADRLDDRSRATTVVRTEIGRVFSVAANERMQQARELVPGIQKQWRRSGKIHSRLNHDAIDGQIRDVDQPFTLGNGIEIMFPRDPSAPPSETINCGCESLPYMSSWDMATPGRRPFSDLERQLSKTKRSLSDEGFDQAA